MVSTSFRNMPRKFLPDISLGIFDLCMVTNTLRYTICMVEEKNSTKLRLPFLNMFLMRTSLYDYGLKVITL